MEDFSHAVSWKGPLEEGANRFTLLLDHDDGGPGSQGLLLYLAAQALRQGAQVYLLAAGAPHSHYLSILRKLGVEKSRLEGNEATFLYQALIPPILPSSSAAEQNGAIDDTRQILKGKIRPDLMQMLRGLSSYLVPASSSSSSSSCSKLVLLDDLSLVEGIYGQDQTISFIQSCRGLIQSAKASLVVCMSTDEIEEETQAEGEGREASSSRVLALMPYLLRNADTLLEVRPLSSGYSRDVHGLITVRSPPGHAPQVVNFKLVEGGIKCGRINRYSGL